MCVMIILLIVAPVTHHDNINLLCALILPTVASFEVDFEKAPNNSTSQLHIFRDKVCLSTNRDYDFKLFGEWPIDSLSRLLMAPGSVTLIMTSQAKEEEALVLKTERGNDICSKLNERHHCRAPAVCEQFQYDNSLAGVQQCDGNSNIMKSSRLSKSCESVHQLRFEPLRSKCKTFPLGSRQLSSSCLPSYFQTKSPLSSDESISKEEYVRQFSDSCSSTSTGYCSNSEHDVTQNQMELGVHKVHTVANEIKDGDELNTKKNENRGEPPPPPIPERQLRRNSAKAESTQQVKEKFSNFAKYSERNSNVKDFTFQRSRSFQIVEQEPLSGRRQRFKSESSLITKTAITELVRPIHLDCSSVNSHNPSRSDSYLQENGATNMEPRKGVCSPKQDKENSCSQTIGEGGVYSFGHKSTAIQSRALTHPFCMPASNNGDIIVDEKSQVKDDMHASDSSTCHYVNLPEGSRPSCYLYMNLPDPKKAPKEASSYVNHVFMSRSMKGIYENVQQFYNEKFETSVSSEETSAPPLPPPALQPRQPPPRLPRRASKAQQGAQKSSDRLPIHVRVPLGPPPPRPPKKQTHVSLTKVLAITLNIALNVLFDYKNVLELCC